MGTQRQHLPAEERREVTVEAVVELAAERNPSDITTAAIAEHMGVTQGALFRHFPTKDAILQSTMEWIATHLLGRVDRAAAKAKSPLAALEAMFMAHVEFVGAHPGVPRMILGELQRAGDTLPKRMVRTLIAQYSERLRVRLAEGKADGELDPELDVAAAAGLFIGVVQGLVVQSLMAGDAARIRRDARKAFAIYARGIRSAP